MAETERPQIYLITPSEFEIDSFVSLLPAVLDVTDVACLRFAAPGADEDQIMRKGDALRQISHERDIPLVIEDHLMMVARLGLDGVHLGDGSRNVRKARDELGADAIVGAFCGASRHDGMTAGEAGADYVSFGPCGETLLGDGTHAETELFQWWSEMIEVPVVAEGGLDEDVITRLAPITDFVAFGPSIWADADPVSKFRSLVKALG